MPTTTDKPTVERQAVSMLRRWCLIAKTHQDVDDLFCNWSDGIVGNGHDTHRLRLRRIIVCNICQQGYFTKETFDEHECFSAY